MAENRFNVTITATDKASKVVNSVNKKINKIFRPYDDAKKSVKSFSDALSRNDLVKRPLWALEKVGKGVTSFGNAFGLAENSVLGGSARIAASLGMIGGPLGGFLAGTAALIGGAGAVTVAMANMGLNISRTAKNLNISTTELQEYRGAAKQAGLSTQAMDSGLQSLGETLQDSLAGRNNQVATLMAQMGIAIGKTRDGAVDTLKAFRDIADVVSHMQDQNQARKLTDMLGITELLPLLREGSAKLDEYIAKQHQLGIQTEEQIKRNQQQAQAWNQTKDAMDSAAISMGNVIAKWLDLNGAAKATSELAEGLQKSNGFWETVGSYLSWALKMPSAGEGAAAFFGEAGPGRGRTNPPMAAPGAGGGRSVSGKVGGVAMGGSSSPLGLRNNNPGNIRAGNGFATYPTPQAGLTAMGRNLIAYQDKHGINTIGGIVNRWAPPSENDTGGYVADVARQTGFGVNQPLDLHNPQVLAPLISAITKHENGQNPYSPEMIQQAANAAAQGVGDRPITVVVQNVPHGMTVKPVRGLGQATVGLTMAPGGMS